MPAMPADNHAPARPFDSSGSSSNIIFMRWKQIADSTLICFRQPRSFVSKFTTISIYYALPLTRRARALYYSIRYGRTSMVRLHRILFSIASGSLARRSMIPTSAVARWPANQLRSADICIWLSLWFPVADIHTTIRFTSSYHRRLAACSA